MMNQIKKSNLFLTIIFFLLAGFLNLKIKLPPLKVEMQDKAINIQESFIEIFSFGQERMIADFLWIITLLDGDLDHYKKSDTNSWMYLRFNLIAALDPQFKRNYVDGGRYLSIIKDDIIGSIDLLKKGFHLFPEDYDINSQLGFIYAFETDRYKDSAFHYKVIRHHAKSSRFIESLITKLRHQEKPDPKVLLNIIEHQIVSLKDEIILKKLKFDLKLVQQEVDLECLNNSLNSCNTLDPWGNTYPVKDNTFTYFDKDKVYKLHKSND